MRRCGARLERARERRLERGDRDATRARPSAAIGASRSRSRSDRRRLGDDRHRMPALRQHLEDAARDLEPALERLVGIGVGAERDRLAAVAGARELALEQRRRVVLGEQLGLEVEPGREPEIGVARPRVAVDAAVLAAAIGVDRRSNGMSGECVAGDHAAARVRRAPRSAAAGPRRAPAASEPQPSSNGSSARLSKRTFGLKVAPRPLCAAVELAWPCRQSSRLRNITRTKTPRRAPGRRAGPGQAMVVRAGVNGERALDDARSRPTAPGARRSRAELVTAAQVGLGQPTLDRDDGLLARGAAGGGRPHRAGAAARRAARAEDLTPAPLQRPHARARVWRRRLRGAGRRRGRGRFRRPAALPARAGQRRATALTPESGAPAALRRPRARSCGAAASSRCARTTAAAASRSTASSPSASTAATTPGRVLAERPRLLQLAPPQPRWPPARLAELGPPRHALGQRPRCGSPRSARTADSAQARQVAGGAARVDRAAGVVAGRPALLRVRPQRLVEPLPRGRRRRACLSARCLPNLPGRPGRSAAAGTASSAPERILACFSQDGTLASRAHRRRRRRAAAGSICPTPRSAASRSTAAARCCAPAGPTGRRRSSLLDPASGAASELCTAGDAAGRSRLSRRTRSRSSFASGRRCGAMPSTTRRPIRTSGAPAGERPPLIVKSHGGPTGSTSSELRLANQFWTSRGFARVRRQLRRQHRLRPRLPRAPERPLGRGRRRGLRERGALSRGGRQGRRATGSRSPAAAPAATPRFAR